MRSDTGRTKKEWLLGSQKVSVSRRIKGLNELLTNEAKSRTWLSDFTFTFHFHALEKEMVTHASVLAWRIPGMGEPGRRPSTGLHRVRHDWSDLAGAAAAGGYTGVSDGKKSACNAGDPRSIPGSGRSPGEGNGNPLPYSCLENSMGQEAWRATVHGVAKCWTGLND